MLTATYTGNDQVSACYENAHTTHFDHDYCCGYQTSTNQGAMRGNDSDVAGIFYAPVAVAMNI